MKKQLIEDILNYFAIDKHHCVAEDHGLICEDICQGKTDCVECWRCYFEIGEWWENEPEPDPDRKWKEMRESD